MPYVTEEIYSYLPNKDESIMISEYPLYDKKYSYSNEEKEIKEMLEYVTLFRNKIHDINCGKNFEVITDINNSLLFNLLKLNDKKVDNSNYKDVVRVNLYNYDISVYFDNSSNIDNEIEALTKEKETLLNSISRREKLLSNTNYVEKAPKNIVDKEKESLAKEKERLEFITKELEKLN